MTHPGRYHLHLTLHGAAAMHGWWDDETVARRMHRQTVGEYGQPGTHVTLTDEQARQLVMDHEQTASDDQAETEDGWPDVYGDSPPVDDYRLGCGPAGDATS